MDASPAAAVVVAAEAGAAAAAVPSDTEKRPRSPSAASDAAPDAKRVKGLDDEKGDDDTIIEVGSRILSNVTVKLTMPNNGRELRVYAHAVKLYEASDVFKVHLTEIAKGGVGPFEIDFGTSHPFLSRDDVATFFCVTDHPPRCWVHAAHELEERLRLAHALNHYGAVDLFGRLESALKSAWKDCLTPDPRTTPATHPCMYGFMAMDKEKRQEQAVRYHWGWLLEDDAKEAYRKGTLMDLLAIPNAWVREEYARVWQKEREQQDRMYEVVLTDKAALGTKLSRIHVQLKTIANNARPAAHFRMCGERAIPCERMHVHTPSLRGAGWDTSDLSVTTTTTALRTMWCTVTGEPMTPPDSEGEEEE